MKLPPLSIIIPARNEEYTISSVLRSLARQERISECQVIVVDGDSTDGTAEVAANFPFVQVLKCEPGRVEQLNYGARNAQSHALWFLHADSTLAEPYHIDMLLEALEDPEVAGGAFRFHLRGDDLYFRIISAVVNLRAQMLGRPYGDQGIFVRSENFRELGGFRHIPACEDIDFVLRLRQIGKFRVLKQRVETSARTWQRHGKIATTTWHVRQWLAYEWSRKLGRLKESAPSVPQDTMEPKASETEPVKTTPEVTPTEPAL